MKKHKFVVQFVEYMISGGVYFWVGSLVLDWLYYGLRWNLWWATIVSNIIGWIVNYLLQRDWVFKNSNLNKNTTHVTGRYIFITLVDFVLNYFILLALRGVGVTPAIGQFISAAIFTPWNYLWYRFWVFPERRDQARAKQSLAHIFAHRPHGYRAFWR